MSKFNILEWWNNTYSLNYNEELCLSHYRKENCLNTDAYNINEYKEMVDSFFYKLPCCNILSNDWTLTVDNCASNFIDRLFEYYVDDETLAIISDAEHDTTVKNFNKCNNKLVLSHNKDIRGYNFDKIIEEAKKYKKVFFYCIGTQISTGEISPQTFFVELKKRFNEEHIENIMVLDAVQEMFLIPRDYSIFDYIIGTAHAICWEYDLGILIHKYTTPIKGFRDFIHLEEFMIQLNIILRRKDKINMFSRCVHEYFSNLLARPEFYIIEDNAPQICSIVCKNIQFTKEIKEILDKYEIRIEAFGNEVQYIRFRAQMFIKDYTLLIKGVRILENYLKGILG